MESLFLKRHPFSPTNEFLKTLAIRYSGKRLLRNEIHLDDFLFDVLLSEQHFRQTASIQRHFFYVQCTRCGNQKRSLMGQILCEKCQKTHYYCRNCIQMGRVMECEPLYKWIGMKPEWPKYTDACTWVGQLTPVQKHAADAIRKTIKQMIGELLVWAVCGAGKTEMLFPGIEKALHQGKRICVATPRSDVVRELLPRIQTAFSNVHVQGLYGGSNDNDGTAELIISTTHQLTRYKNAFDVMIIDEVDAFPFHADPGLMYATNRAKKQTNTTIYLTATPREAYKKRMKVKQLPYVFVPSRFHGHPLPVPTFKMCFSLQKDFQKNQPPFAFLKWMKTRDAVQRQVLIFVPTIKLAEKMTKRLQDTLVSDKILPSETAITCVHAEDDQRKEKIQQFRENVINVLVTTTILERGVTFPSVDVAILDAGHDVFDEAALVQISGRAGRSANDPTGEVVFFHSGKTKAMVNALYSIKMMNKRGGFV